MSDWAHHVIDCVSGYQLNFGAKITVWGPRVRRNQGVRRVKKWCFLGGTILGYVFGVVFGVRMRLKHVYRGFWGWGIEWRGRNFDPGSQKIFAGYPGGQKIKFFEIF
jgi:hypothetical protein